jgi:hypothetical protein
MYTTFFIKFETRGSALIEGVCKFQPAKFYNFLIFFKQFNKNSFKPLRKICKVAVMHKKSLLGFDTWF